MADVAQFKARFPEFDSATDLRVQLFLDDAALIMTSAGKWLTYYDVAQLYHAAHLLVAAEATESGDFSPISPIKEQEVDDVTIKSAVSDSKASESDLYSTSYGKRYVFYRKICLTGPRGA